MVARPTNARPASATKCAVRLQPEPNARTTATMAANKEKHSERSSLRQGRTCREKEGNYVEGFHTLSDDRPRNRGADPHRPRGGADEPLPLSRRGRGQAGAQPSRHSDDCPARVRARHREDCEHARLQPICGQDPGVLLRRERRHLPPRPARAAGKPRRTGNRAAARTELRPHRGHSARARSGAHAVRACGRAVLIPLLPRAHRSLLQPQRPFRTRARPALSPQRELANARRSALPQRRVRPAGAQARARRNVRGARRARRGVHGRRAGHFHAAPLHARRMRRARSRHDRICGQGPPRRDGHGRARRARRVRFHGDGQGKRADHKQPHGRHRERKLRQGPHRHERGDV